MSIDFSSKTTYGDRDRIYIYLKIKTYADMVPCKHLSIIMLDSVIESGEKYYPQTFLEECKYIQEKIKFENYFDEELDSDSDNDNE